MLWLTPTIGSRRGQPRAGAVRRLPRRGKMFLAPLDGDGSDRRRQPTVVQSAPEKVGSLDHKPLGSVNQIVKSNKLLAHYDGIYLGSPWSEYGYRIYVSGSLLR